MSIPTGFENLVGQWKGVKKLWMSPTEPMHESDTLMKVATTARGKFLTLNYNWDFEGFPQDGLLLVGVEEKTNKVAITWVDSWHMGDAVMTCKGRVEKDGSIYALGSYPAPTGPDWGWSIRLKLIREGMEDYEYLKLLSDAGGAADAGGSSATCASACARCSATTRHGW